LRRLRARKLVAHDLLHRSQYLRLEISQFGFSLLFAGHFDIPSSCRQWINAAQALQPHDHRSRQAESISFSARIIQELQMAPIFGIILN